MYNIHNLFINYKNKRYYLIFIYQQTSDCDAVLARMQDMLLGFQADLVNSYSLLLYLVKTSIQLLDTSCYVKGGISEEIKHLQDESMSMSVRLKNRKAAEDLLSDFIDRSTLPIGLYFVFNKNHHIIR